MDESIWDDPEVQKGIRQAERGEWLHRYPVWKRMFNPFLRVKYWYRHRFGKWRHLNDR